jgi:hypothetical protein
MVCLFSWLDPKYWKFMFVLLMEANFFPQEMDFALI